MADAIVRLRVESSEYDQKLSRATQQLQHMEKEVRRTGATFAYADKEELEFIKSLGSMETKADSAKGKIAEMTKSFTELSLQYNRLTKEEKASPFGKTLASSLDQLKTRIKDSKSELAGVEGQLTSFGDVAKQMGAKLGIPVEQLTKFGPYGAAAAAALKVATDAFKQNEEFMDEWGRTTEAAGTVYQGFLNALNTGDLGGFLRNIGNIISKSREAYDAMDQLGTFNAFNQIQIEGARTDFTEAMANYREGSGSKEDVKAAADRLKNEMQSRQDKEQAAYIAAIKELAASRGVDEEMLQKALSGTYGDYETLKNTPLARHEEQIWNGNMYGKTTTTKVTWSADTMEQKLGEALRKLNDDELAHIQSLGAQAQRTATEIAQVDKQTVRVLGTKRESANGGGGAGAETTLTYANDSIKAQEAKVAELTKLWKEASAELRDGYYAQLQKAKFELEEMTKGPLTELKGQMAFDIEPIKVKVDTKGLVTATNDADKMRVSWSAAASAISTVGSALQQIDDPAAKIAGLVATAVAQIALGFAQATASPVTSAAGVFGWIAAATTGLATMISTITAIKSVTSAGNFAGGGVVGGNSYSGDNLIAHVNSGETILNAAQSDAIAAQLNANPFGNLQLSTKLNGTQLLILLNNTNRSLGGSRNFYTERH